MAESKNLYAEADCQWKRIWCLLQVWFSVVWCSSSPRTGLGQNEWPRFMRKFESPFQLKLLEIDRELKLFARSLNMCWNYKNLFTCLRFNLFNLPYLLLFTCEQLLYLFYTHTYITTTTCIFFKPFCKSIVKSLLAATGLALPKVIAKALKRFHVHFFTLLFFFICAQVSIMVTWLRLLRLQLQLQLQSNPVGQWRVLVRKKNATTTTKKLKIKQKFCPPGLFVYGLCTSI